MLLMYIPVLLSIVGSHPTTTPLAVYNQAYQEKFSADTINEIIVNAKDAYVLVDPFNNDGVASHIPTIQSKNNQVGGYISAGTGEDWRDDFSALEPYLTTKEWPEWKGEFFVKETPQVFYLL